MEFLRRGLSDDTESVATAADAARLRKYISRNARVTAEPTGTDQQALETQEVSSTHGSTPGVSGPSFESMLRAALMGGEGDPKEADVTGFVSDALLSFLEACARTHALDPDAVRFSFCIGLIRTMVDQSKMSSQIREGDLASRTITYPVAATHVMLRVDLRDAKDSFDRVYRLCKALDESLPWKRPHTFTIEHADSRGIHSTRWAARCAIPFAFGFSKVLPDDKLDFASRSLAKGEDKSVTYALNFLLSHSVNENIIENTLKPTVNAEMLRTILARIPLPIAVCRGLGYHFDSGKGYEMVSTKHFVDRVRAHRGVIPTCKGSVLRGFARSQLDIELDDIEPDIQHPHDCIPTPATSD